MKKCSCCKKKKPLSKFVRSKRSKDGRGCYCILCHRKKAKAYSRLHPEKRREGSLKQNYGITAKQHAIMFEQQQGCCGICGIPQSELTKVLCVDHSHTTGQVRGLLCSNCNIGLGRYENWYKKQKTNIKTYLKG